MSRTFRAVACVSIALTSLATFGCRTADPQGSSVKADIHDIDVPVRVIYKDTDGFVYLVTCPKENGEVVDHAFDDLALSRDACSKTKADVDANGQPLVKKMNFQSDYLPKLKTALGLASTGPTTAADVAAIQAQINVQADHLNKLAVLAVTAEGVNKAKIDSEMAIIGKKMDDLKATLAGAAGTQSQLTLLNTLLGFLDINSTATFNIAEANAGRLLAPFEGVQDVSNTSVANSTTQIILKAGSYAASDGQTTYCLDTVSDASATGFSIKFVGLCSGASCAFLCTENVCKSTSPGCDKSTIKLKSPTSYVFDNSQSGERLFGPN